LAGNLLLVPYSSPYGDDLTYSTIFTPPKYSKYDGKRIDKTSDASRVLDADIDYRRISLQSLAILLMTGAGIILTLILRTRLLGVAPTNAPKSPAPPAD